MLNNCFLFQIHHRSAMNCSEEYPLMDETPNTSNCTWDNGYNITYVGEGKVTLRIYYIT